MKGQQLLKRAMGIHGGDVDTFAREVLGRSRVSVWRWLKKENPTPIPQTAIDRLKSYLTSEESDA